MRFLALLAFATGLVVAGPSLNDKGESTKLNLEKYTADQVNRYYSRIP